MIIYEQNKQDLSNIFVNPIYYGTETGVNWCNCTCFWCYTPGSGTIWGDGRFCFVTGCGQINGIFHCGASPNKYFLSIHRQYSGTGKWEILCPIFEQTNNFYMNIRITQSNSCSATHQYYITDGTCIYKFRCSVGTNQCINNYEKIFLAYNESLNCLDIHRNCNNIYCCSTIPLSGWNPKNIKLVYSTTLGGSTGYADMGICHYNYLNIKNGITFEQFCKLGMLK